MFYLEIKSKNLNTYVATFQTFYNCIVLMYYGHFNLTIVNQTLIYRYH